MQLREDLKAGDEIVIQIAPFGEYPAESVGGVQLVEVFDRDGFENIIENWKADGSKLIRADFDHKSEMTDDTIASGWLKDLFIDDDKGLMGTLVVSESGASALNGLDYRFGSPVFILDDASKPTHLLSYAFTNRPRLKDMDAVYNSEKPTMATEVNTDIEEEKMDTEEVKEEVETPTEEIKEEVKEEVQEPVEEVQEPVEEVQEPVEEPVEEPKVDFITEVKGILGLPEEATEADAKAAIAEIVEKLKAIADKEIAEEAIEVVDACGVEDDKKEEVINCYKKSPELVRTVLNCFKKTPVKMVVNSEEAQKPELTEGEKLRREYESLKGGQDRVDFLLKNKNIKF